MNKIIVFDFNRTLYDPESGRLIYGVRPLLQELRQSNFRLFLITRAGSSRSQVIDRLGLKQFFDQVICVSYKSSRPFRRIIAQTTTDLSQSFVVGDRVRQEIRIGQQCGLKGVWIKRGKFREEAPRSAKEQPDYIITNLRALKSVVRE